ncbi:rad52 recombinase [uncultured Mediterranean phage uvMED]|nr:rad52 recombinase [uncultured Mediterranean phage uvMED]
MTTTLPNLAGVIKTTDIYKKMKFDYVAWAKTAQILREHAPGWQFCLDQSSSENELSSYVFKAPDGSGFLMGYFQHIDTGLKTTLFPFAITDNANRPITLDRVSCVHFQNSHRRCLCACACFAFGLAYELWAQIEIDEAKQVTPEPKKGIARTPTKPKQQLEAVESIKDKNYGTPISPNALSAVVSKMKNLSEQFPDKKDSVINKFKKQFDIKAEKIGPADIRTAEQGQFLTIAINEIDSSL